MISDQVRARRWPQFTIRAALGATLLAALAFGWYSSLQREAAKVARLSAHLAYAEAELEWGQTRAEERGRPDVRSKQPPQGVLSSARLNGANLRAASILGGDSSFQRTWFCDCDLRSASLQGGAAAFQIARFDHANLTGAKLTGGGASFQAASFVQADLSGAVLTGGGSAFQMASLEGAKLVGARIICSGAAFQMVNIDGAQFQGADLSLIDRGALASCYFKIPPAYDEKTRFPAGFDPAAQHWTVGTASRAGPRGE